MTQDPAVQVATWLTEPLPQAVSKSLQRLARSEDVQWIAVMPDVHLAGDVCNGTVIATKDLVYPLAVGADIGCGMLAVAINLTVDVLADEASAGRVLAGLYQRVPSNKHVVDCVPATLPGELRQAQLSSPSLEKQKQRDGLYQLGTLGRGNHFVELQADRDDRLWLMLHSGSRGMGQTITNHHLRRVTASASGLGHLRTDSVKGQDYLSDLTWAIDYAIQNRLAMARAVESLMQFLFSASVDWSTLIHCHHNHARREIHFGEMLWVHRKGALPAGIDQSGVIPGSMGSASYHVAGRGVEASMQSCSHGAGRALPRHQAQQKVSRQDLVRQMHGVWFDQRRADQLRDEAPAAYKEIGRVMRAQRELTRIVRELRPVLVYKGC